MIVSGLVHYVRIFNSWVDAYDYSTDSPKLTGVPFNDAYRYMDWLLTVPLPLFEILLVMKLGEVASDQLEAYSIAIKSDSVALVDERNLMSQIYVWNSVCLGFISVAMNDTFCATRKDVHMFAGFEG